MRRRGGKTAATANSSVIEFSPRGRYKDFIARAPLQGEVGKGLNCLLSLIVFIVQWMQPSYRPWSWLEWILAACEPVHSALTAPSWFKNHHLESVTFIKMYTASIATSWCAFTIVFMYYWSATLKVDLMQLFIFSTEKHIFMSKRAHLSRGCLRTLRYPGWYSLMV